MTEFDGHLVVADKQPLAAGVVRLALAAADGGELPAWTPGAHVDLLLGNGIVRQYSLCGDPADTTAYQVAVLCEPHSRGGSQYVHDVLAVGDTVAFRKPRNNFELIPARRYQFIAGGVGITPLLPMLAAADKAGADWRLTYGGRTRASMAFLDELGAYGERVSIRPQDECGLIDLRALLDPPRPDTLVYCCGPEALLTAVEQHCAHWPSGALRVERFAPKEFDDQPVTSFEVVLKQSGITVHVPEDRSVLEVITEAGVAVMSSCTEGTCGTCETAIVEGRADHRDCVLSDEERAENATMMVCVSRSLGQRLVLDL
jgi:ferredoxin-NADP reductase